MGQVRFSAQALREQDAVFAHIAKDNFTAALRWFDELHQLLELLADQPFIGSVYQSQRGIEFRRFALGNYLLYYRVNKQGIFLARIVHGARDQTRIV